jgi:uncharacterized integral membrane protein
MGKVLFCVLLSALLFFNAYVVYFDFFMKKPIYHNPFFVVAYFAAVAYVVVWFIAWAIRGVVKEDKSKR